MGCLTALQRKGPGGPPWVRMFLWLGENDETSSGEPLPSVPHMGQDWVSSTRPDPWLLSPVPGTWVDSSGKAIDGICAELGMEAPAQPALDCRAGPSRCL